jgi:hypothetical protein
MPLLTISYRRADVAGFWTVGTFIIVLSIGWGASGFGAQAPWGWALAAAAALVVPGLFWRPWFDRGVWVWNGVVQRVARIMRYWMLAVCYYVLFPAVGLTGSTFSRVSRGRGSSWHPRNLETSLHDTIGASSEAVGEPDLGLMAFCRTRGNAWALTLRPIALLLLLLREERQDHVVPGSTYTLY